MSSYTEDLHAVLQAPSKDGFLPLWLCFTDRHYPGRAQIEIGIEVLSLLRPQIEPQSWWRFIFLFCENRLALSAIDAVAWPEKVFDLHSLLEVIRKPMGLTVAEIASWVGGMARQNSAETWQYDRVLAALLWRARDREGFFAFQQEKLAAGAVSSLYCVEFTRPPGNPAIPAMTMADGRLDLTPASHPDLWEVCAWHCRGERGALKLDAPFCFDTNHLPRAGLFSLLAGCTLGGLEGGAPVLAGADLSVEIEGPGRIFCGLSFLERGAEGKPTGRSGYWLLERALTTEPLRLDVDDPAWKAMGRNPLSLPFAKYYDPPLADVLARPHGLFLVLMQDDDPTPKRDSVRIGRVEIRRPVS